MEKTKNFVLRHRMVILIKIAAISLYRIQLLFFYFFLHNNSFIEKKTLKLRTLYAHELDLVRL